MEDRIASMMNRSFTAVQTPGLTDEARRAVNGAFDAMSTWRAELAATSEKHGEKVLDKMAGAAKALGWPAQIVDNIRSQMDGATKMQVQMMDQMMDAWEAQIKSPNAMANFPAEMMSKLQSLPGFPAGTSFPGMQGFPGMGGMMGGMGGAANPFQFWQQIGEQWQKNWAEAMTSWSKNGAGR